MCDWVASMSDIFIHYWYVVLGDYREMVVDLQLSFRSSVNLAMVILLKKQSFYFSWQARLIWRIWSWIRYKCHYAIIRLRSNYIHRKLTGLFFQLHSWAGDRYWLKKWWGRWGICLHILEFQPPFLWNSTHVWMVPSPAAPLQSTEATAVSPMGCWYSRGYSWGQNWRMVTPHFEQMEVLPLT